MSIFSCSRYVVFYIRCNAYLYLYVLHHLAEFQIEFWKTLFAKGLNFVLWHSSKCSFVSENNMYHVVVLILAAVGASGLKPCPGDTRGDMRCNHDPTHRNAAVRKRFLSFKTWVYKVSYNLIFFSTPISVKYWFSSQKFPSPFARLIFFPTA